MISASENPFATFRVESLLAFKPEWSGTSWEKIDTDLEKLNYRAAIIGPHGSGKTTLMEALEKRLRDRGETLVNFFLNDETPKLPEPLPATVDQNTIILLDGAEQLGPIAWRRFLRRIRQARGLIITAHRTGRLPLLLKTESSPALLQRCIDVLDPTSSVSAEKLYKRHRGNLREALIECYRLVNRH